MKQIGSEFYAHILAAIAEKLSQLDDPFNFKFPNDLANFSYFDGNLKFSSSNSDVETRRLVRMRIYLTGHKISRLKCLYI